MSKEEEQFFLKRMSEFVKFANEKFFNSEINLTGLKLKLSGKMIRKLGLYTLEDGVRSITIAKSIIHMRDIAWQTIVLHEMIHVLQSQKFYRVDHGDFFLKKAAEIRSINSDYNVQPESEDADIKSTLSAIKDSRAIDTLEYVVQRGEDYNFIKNLTQDQLKDLESMNAHVWVNIGRRTETVVFSKNWDYFIDASVAYDWEDVEASFPNLKKLF